MLRQDLLRAANTLAGTLSPLADFLLEMFQRTAATKAKKTNIVLELHHRIRRAEAAFGEPERELIKIFNLQQIFDEKFWVTVLNTEDASGQMDLHTAYSSLNNAVRFLPKVAALLKRDYQSPEKEGGKSEATAAGSALATIILPESEAQSTPKRVTDAISGFVDLYDVCAELADVPANGLAIVGCDSGSDKSFDFLGVAAAIKATKAVIMELLDKAIYYRELKYAEKIKCVAEALSVLDTIGSLEGDGKLEREKAELLRRQVLSGATKLLETGALIPEMKGAATFEPKYILAAAPTLLLSGPQGHHKSEPRNVPEAEPKSEVEDDGLSDEERDVLKALMKKRRSRVKGRAKSQSK